MRVFRDLYPVHIRLTIERLVLPDNLKCPDDDQQKDQAIAAQHDCHNPSLLKSPGPLLKSIPSEEGKTEQVVPDVKQPDIPDVAQPTTKKNRTQSSRRKNVGFLEVHHWKILLFFENSDG